MTKLEEKKREISQALITALASLQLILEREDIIKQHPAWKTSLKKKGNLFFKEIERTELIAHTVISGKPEAMDEVLTMVNVVETLIEVVYKIPAKYHLELDEVLVNKIDEFKSLKGIKDE